MYEKVSAVPSAVLFENVDSIAVENVHILYSFGLGLVIWNSFGSVSVYNSDFSYNGWKNFSTDVNIGGNALFYYNTNTIPAGQTDLQVIRSTFRYGYGSSDYCFQWFYEHSKVSGGLSIVVVGSGPGWSDITITISDSTFHSNQAINGANMVVSVDASSHVYLSILNSSFNNGTALGYGGGLYIGLFYRSAPVVCDISGLIFSGNSANKSGGGLYVYVSGSNYPMPSLIMNISNATFSMNRAEEYGGGVYIKSVKKSFDFIFNILTKCGWRRGWDVC